MSSWKHHIFSGVYLFGYLVAIVRWFLFSERATCVSLNGSQATASHGCAAYQALVQGLKKREGSKGVHCLKCFALWSAKHTSVQEHQWCRWDPVLIFLKSLGLAQKVSGRAPIHFYQIRSSLFKQLNLPVVIHCHIKHFLTKHLQAHKSLAVYCIVYNVLCHSCL